MERYMTKEDVQRIWLLSGVGFLATVTVVAISVFIFANVDYPPVLLPVLGSFLIFLLDVAILSSAGKSSGVLLFFGRFLLWLGLLCMITAVVLGALSLLNMF